MHFAVGEIVTITKKALCICAYYKYTNSMVGNAESSFILSNYHSIKLSYYHSNFNKLSVCQRSPLFVSIFGLSTKNNSFDISYLVNGRLVTILARLAYILACRRIVSQFLQKILKKTVRELNLVPIQSGYKYNKFVES